MITADNITDEQIEALFASLPPGHYAVQWCLDARFPSASHPHCQRNARRQCAEILNASRESVDTCPPNCDPAECNAFLSGRCKGRQP